MSDAQIIQRMNEDRDFEYYQESLRFKQSAEEAYSDCREHCDNELNEAYTLIRDVLKHASSVYGYSVTEILNDMVIPSLEVEVLR